MEPTDPEKICRREGVESSREAADGHVRSGANVAQKKLILAQLLKAPGSTVDDVAAAVGMDQLRVGKRLSDLAKDHLIKQGDFTRSKVSGRKMLTWWPTELAVTPNG